MKPFVFALSLLIYFTCPVSAKNNFSGTLPPAITSFSPASGPIGTTITISGSNFDAALANNIVFFGATRASISAATANSLTVTVPAGATYQPISVLNNSSHLTGYSDKPFIVTFDPGKSPFSKLNISKNALFDADAAPTNMASGDLDGDGKPDLVVISPTGNTLSIYRNTSIKGSVTSSSLSAKQDFATGKQPNSVAIGDIDGDGKPDIVVSNYSSSTFSVFRNTAVSGSINAASFAPRQDFSTGSGPAGIAIADLDGDGKPEIIVVNKTSNSVSVFFNKSIPGSITSASFGNEVNFATYQAPIRLAVGDLDGDGKPDIVVVNTGTDPHSYISIFHNTTVTGAITATSFAPKQDFDVGYSPNNITICDLDNDGKPDLVVSNLLSAISIFHNTSSSGVINASSFAGLVKLPTAGQSGIAVGDLDGDGKPDIITAGGDFYKNNTVNGSISVNSFKRLLQINPGNFYGIIIGDMDGDGRPDIASTVPDSNKVCITLNQIPTTPAISSFYPSSGTTGSLVTIKGSNFDPAAANNIVFFGATMASVKAATDSSLSVEVPSGSTYKPISVLNAITHLTAYSTLPFITTFKPNKGNITSADISAKQDFATGNTPVSVAIGDLDGDGKPDIAVADSAANTVSVFRNISVKGTINTASFALKQDFATGSGPRCVIIGDLDGDGKPELVTANFKDNTVSVFYNTSSPGSITSSSFAARQDFNAGSKPHNVVMGDLDGDGKPDLAMANYDPAAANQNIPSIISVLHNTSAKGSITATSFASPVTVVASANDFSGSFVTYPSTYDAVIADFNNDNRPDLAAVEQPYGQLRILKNQSSPGTLGSGSFTAPVNLPNLSDYDSMEKLTVGDINGDGKSDVVMVINGKAAYIDPYGESHPADPSGYVATVLNSSTSTGISFNNATLFNLHTKINDAALGDIDGDGKPDLITANFNDNTISVLHNTTATGSSATTFDNQITFATGVKPVSVAIGDLDGDGMPDIVTANAGSNTISIFHNNPLLDAPTIADQHITFSAITDKSATVSWTKGNGQARAVFIKAATTGSPAPADGTAYEANAILGAGAPITGGWYCVYNGVDSTVNVTGLTYATGYRVMVAEYNNSGSKIKYQTTASAGNPANFTTNTPVVTLSSLALTLNDGSFTVPLSPTFNPAVTSYTTVPFGPSVSSVSVTANCTDASTTLKINNTTVTQGTGVAVNLTNGINTITVLVLATNNITQQSYTITIDKESAILVVSPRASVTGTVGVAYSGLFSATGGTAPYAFNSSGTLPPGLSLNVNGNLTGTPTAGGVYNFSVTATDQTTGVGPYTGSANYNLTINPPVIVVLPATLTAATSGLNYSSTLTASGGTAPYTFALASGTLPQGLSLSANGVLSGIPAHGGSSAFSITATDNSTGSGPYTASQAYSMVVTPSDNDDLSALSISNGSIAFGSATTNYNIDVTNDITAVTVTPTAANANAVIKVKINDGGYTIVSSGSSSSALPLTTGNNEVSILVTAEDGVVTKTYTIAVYKALEITAISATNILSPNGDGKNENWIIKDIQLYPKNTVKVFDRGGREVYAKDGYNNDWTGTINGSPLTQGTYYYVVNLGPGLRSFKGFITILKGR